tara:strand:- start:185 stop:643 length:459 start_codon:yes stop_codon:yes gene_type:complete
MTAIEGFEDYLIFEDGKVFSIKTNIFLKPCKDGGGYLQITLSKNGKQYTKSIHRLMGLNLIPNPDNKPEIDHIDRNRTNNNLTNLRWTTKAEQSQNTGVSKNNKLDIKNISYDKSQDRYRFQKIINGNYHSKRFITLDEAVAYKEQYELTLN